MFENEKFTKFVLFSITLCDSHFALVSDFLSVLVNDVMKS